MANPYQDRERILTLHDVVEMLVEHIRVVNPRYAARQIEAGKPLACVSSVRYHIDQGHLRPYARLGRTLIFTRREVRHFLDGYTPGKSWKDMKSPKRKRANSIRNNRKRRGQPLPEEMT